MTRELVLGSLVVLSVVWTQAAEQSPASIGRNAVVNDVRALVAGDKGPKIKPHFIPLPAGAVRPTGWLNDWARDAAAGITGHLDERAEVFKHGYKGYHFEARGVKAPGVGWPVEQCAYWLDGLVRLA
ncbi:MAG: hypothetical protein NTY01_04765, partial [Verrucomicrobia bacterium]|nr:hypothetical protein [Verrucomicrobiota bacterium]